MDLPPVIEALLIASEEPLPSSDLARLVRARLAELDDEAVNEGEEAYEADSDSAPDASLANTSEEDVVAAIGTLNAHFEASGRAFLILERAKGWSIYTRPEFAGFVRHLFPGQKPRKLSPPAMETLAIIAYRQPVTKAAIEAVRGVSCDGMIQKLLDLELIKIGGRAELPGRPLLYGTTDYFFEHFGIKHVDELPNAAELRYVPLPDPEPEAAPSEDETESGEQQLSLAEPSGEPPATEESPGDDFAGPAEPVDAPATDHEETSPEPDPDPAEKAPDEETHPAESTTPASS
jgi:segregation and condensation protein B